MPLLGIYNNPRRPDALAKNGAKKQMWKSLVQVERMGGVVLPRFRWNEVAPVIGGNGSAREKAEKRDGKCWACDADSGVIPLEDAGNTEWREQALYLYDAMSPKLSRFLRRLGLRSDEMDDVIQESFLRTCLRSSEQ